ncbi:LAFE_0A05820g1_1 [Lachancea fermentati]|uniref:LAFE_0A05820g1_1 n=1 Tax=Lachancea fermentati TaxID=4955 RepID=A0A1G4M787_LACFM|nr:LAFE_0A05820g1_1 [Lachancea fermentati]
MLKVHLRRSFTSCSRFYKQSSPLKSVYGEILNNPALVTLKSGLPQEYEEFQPYGFSKIIRDAIERSEIDTSSKITIHNQMIEMLTDYDYGIATIHSKELQRLSGKLSADGFIKLIQNNPGRAKTSWELFLEYLPIARSIDGALTTVLGKVLFLDLADVKDGKKYPDIEDLSRAIALIETIKSKELITEDYWERLLECSLVLNASSILPYIMQHYPVRKRDKLIENDITDFQFFQLAHKQYSELMKGDEACFLKLLRLIGEMPVIEMTEEEKAACSRIERELIRIKKLICEVDIQLSPCSIKTGEIYKEIVTEVRKSGSDRGNIQLAKIILRTMAMYKNDIESALKLYHSYMVTNADHPSDLMYEMFLAFAYQAFKTSDEKLLIVAEAFIPQTVSPSMKLNVYRALILAYSKFNPQKSLEIFNSHIQDFSKEVNPQSFKSASGLFVESLILAQLANKDREFSHVIFEGAVGEGILSGPTAIKGVKAIFAHYGELLERDSFKKDMQGKILSTLQTL